MTTKTKLPTLEKSLEEVTTVIEKMEQGELTLEQSLNHFERGVVLIKHCQKILQEAEQKVQLLMQNQHNEETLLDYHEHENHEQRHDSDNE